MKKVYCDDCRYLEEELTLRNGSHIKEFYKCIAPENKAYMEEDTLQLSTGTRKGK